MAGVRIGPCRIADLHGTHEPGEVVEYPSAALLDLAKSRVADPETKLPYCELLGDTKTAAPTPAATEKT